jgi:lysyl-tRNA synthetase class I
MAKQWKILARQKWVAGCTITESHDIINSTKDVAIRKFTATIRGFQNWLIYCGDVRKININEIIKRVQEIRDRIDSGDETVFYEDVSIKIPICGKCGKEVPAPDRLSFESRGTCCTCYLMEKHGEGGKVDHA